MVFFAYSSEIYPIFVKFVNLLFGKKKVCCIQQSCDLKGVQQYRYFQGESLKELKGVQSCLM